MFKIGETAFRSFGPVNYQMRVEMVTRSWKATRYKYFVCTLGLYNTLKDLPCCGESIDVCYKWLFKNMQWV